MASITNGLAKMFIVSWTFDLYCAQMATTLSIIINSDVHSSCCLIIGSYQPSV